ncbi:MAG TPA: winged helix-turn-helix domain-containing protein [Umezawaea sp.]|nr:winged helix-turn-helix domain-containing protein [Umezawaea sp.]
MSLGDELSRSSLQVQVASKIRDDINSGRLRHGQALPSTRDLAQQWDVSIFTVNEAMKLLIHDGLVISKSRSGRVVHSPGQPPADEVAQVRADPDPVRRGRRASDLIALYQQRANDLAQIRRDAIDEAHDVLGSYTEVAKALGLTKGRITQIRQAAPPTPD